jgi:hypothetical protein
VLVRPLEPAWGTTFPQRELSAEKVALCSVYTEYTERVAKESAAVKHRVTYQCQVDAAATAEARG